MGSVGFVVGWQRGIDDICICIVVNMMVVAKVIKAVGKSRPKAAGSHHKAREKASKR